MHPRTQAEELRMSPLRRHFLPEQVAEALSNEHARHVAGAAVAVAVALDEAVDDRTAGEPLMRVETRAVFADEDHDVACDAGNFGALVGENRLAHVPHVLGEDRRPFYLFAGVIDGP